MKRQDYLWMCIQLECSVSVQQEKSNIWLESSFIAGQKTVFFTSKELIWQHVYLQKYTDTPPISHPLLVWKLIAYKYVSYLVKHTTGKSKDMASPNLSVQSSHATCLPHVPPSDTEISYLRQCSHKHPDLYSLTVTGLHHTEHLVPSGLTYMCKIKCLMLSNCSNDKQIDTFTYNF